MTKQKQRQRQVSKQMQSVKKIEIKKNIPKIEIKEQGWWKWVFMGLAAAIFLALPLMSIDAGNSGDEDGWQHPQSEHLYQYYTSFGKDTSYINSMQLEYSGYAFDAATMFVIKALKADDYMAVRHVMNALMGALLMLFVGLFAKLIGGWRAGCIALLLIFVSPQVLGHSFNNPKDIPFAAFFMGAIYYIAWFIKEYPNPTWKTAVKLGLMIGGTIGIRPGGFLLVPYFGLFVMAYYLIVNEPKKYFSKTNILVIKKILTKAFVALVTMVVIMFILWPYAWRDPIQNIPSSFKIASHFIVSLRQLYEGSMIWSDASPWYYTLKYILITSPIAIFMGTIVYLFTVRKFEKGYFWLFVLLFSFAFPIFWMVYSKANVYGGWRHSLFAYPPLVIAAGLGFNSLVILFKNKYLKIAAIALPFVLLIMPMIHIIKNHPYQYVYFNKLAGGIEKAYGNYELDYYYHSTREATEWVIANAQKSGLETSDKIIVSSWHTPSVGYFLRNDTAKFLNGFSRWGERANNDWDYAIFVVTGMPPEQIKSKHFPPKNTVHTITVDGNPICIILKREDKSDLIGYQYKSENQIDSAIYYFNKALDLDPYNEVVMINLMETYFQTGNLDTAKLYIDRVLDFLPNHETVNSYLAHYYLATDKPDEALSVLQKLIKINFKNSQAYRLASNIYLQRNDLKSAEKMLEKLIDIDQLDNQIAKQLVEIYKFQGLNNEAAAYKKLYTVIANSLEKRGKEKEAEEYRSAAQKIF